jgi:hypothetical protein
MLPDEGVWDMGNGVISLFILLVWGVSPPANLLSIALPYPPFPYYPKSPQCYNQGA